MSKVLHSRLFRFLVCFLVVCCILVNCSPIKAEATTVVGTGITLSAVLAWLFSAAIGVVAIDLSVESLNRIGDNFRDVVLTDANNSSISAYENLEENFINYLSSVQFDRNLWAEDLHTVFTSDTLKNVASWLCDLVKVGGYEVEDGTAPVGKAYYNGVLLPEMPEGYLDSYDWMICSYLSYYRIFRIGSDLDFVKSTADSEYYARSSLTSSTKSTYYRNDLRPTDAFPTTGYGYNNVGVSYPVVWADHDLYDDKGVLIMPGTLPSATKTTIIEPTSYVGDIPQSIIEGKENEETLTIPIVDPLTAIATPATAREDINALIAGLKNGTITLDDYLEKVRAEAITTTPDVTTPSVDPSDPTIPEVPDEPVSNITPYGLDLKDYFPFCIPFDIYEFFSVLIAEPTAPQFHWEFQDLSGNTYSIDVDLSPWDSFAAVFRRMQLLLFIVGLAAASRKFIKW